MNVMWKIVMLSIVLNFATGIMIQIIPAFENAPGSRMGLKYNENYSQGMTDGYLNDTIAPGNIMEDKGNLIYRVLDMMNIGFIYNFLKMIHTYLFGFIIVLDSMFGGFILSQSEALHTMIFGSIKTIVIIAYILGGFRLWTGKDIIN